MNQKSQVYQSLCWEELAAAQQFILSNNHRNFMANFAVCIYEERAKCWLIVSHGIKCIPITMKTLYSLNPHTLAANFSISSLASLTAQGVSPASFLSIWLK